jgi:hypothetical protein
MRKARPSVASCRLVPIRPQPSTPPPTDVSDIEVFRGWSAAIAEMNRIRLVVFDINNRMFGPYSARIDRIRISITCPMGHDRRWAPRRGEACGLPGLGIISRGPSRACRRAVLCLSRRAPGRRRPCARRLWPGRTRTPRSRQSPAWRRPLRAATARAQPTGLCQPRQTERQTDRQMVGCTPGWSDG